MLISHKNDMIKPDFILFASKRQIITVFLIGWNIMNPIFLIVILNHEMNAFWFIFYYSNFIHLKYIDQLTIWWSW